MIMKDIKRQDVMDGRYWIVPGDGSISTAATLHEAVGFTANDVGLLSAVIKLADQSEHLALVLQSFVHDGDETDIFIYSEHGWIDIQTDGIHRALGKYNHEMFPFDYFISTKWNGGKQPAPDKNSDHPAKFREIVSRMVLPQE